MSAYAIETRYAGHRFRSRLEARWAVFFEALSVEWHYEHQGYETPRGRYLPDFWLPSIGGSHKRGLIVEIKPRAESPHSRAVHVAEGLGANVTVLGGVPDPRDVSESEIAGLWGETRTPFDDDRGWLISGGTDDSAYLWCACPGCNAVGFEYEGRSSRAKHREGCSEPRHDRGHGAAHGAILDAYRAARSARFEWEERQS